MERNRGSLCPLPRSCPGEQLGGGTVGQCGTCPPSPSRGVEKGRGTGGNRDAGQIAHPGGPEYALHSADGAQPGGNAPPHPTPPPSAPPMHASHPQSLPCSSLLGLREEGRPTQSGERDRWFCKPCVGCCVWTQAQYCQPEHYIDSRIFIHTSRSSVGGHGCVFWG